MPSFCQVSLPEKTFFLSEIPFSVSGFPQNRPSFLSESAFFLSGFFLRKTSFLSEIPFFVSGFPQNSPFFWAEIAFFLSGFSLRKDLLSVRYLLSVRFPSATPYQKSPSFHQVSLETSFFLSEIAFFLSGFSPRKELSVKNLLSITFPSEMSFFLSCRKLPSFCQVSFPPKKGLLSVRNLHLSVSISSSKNTFFLSEFSFFPSYFPKKCPFCQKLSSFCHVYLPEKTLFLSGIFFPSGFPQKHPSFCQKFFLSSFSPRKDCISVRNPLICVRFPSELSFFFCQKLPSFCPYLSPRKDLSF